MNLIAILIALGLEQWRAFRWRSGVPLGESSSFSILQSM